MTSQNPVSLPGSAERRGGIPTPSEEIPGTRHVTSEIKEDDLAGFEQLIGQRMIGSFVEIEPTRFVPTSYYMLFLYTQDKFLYLQDVNLEDIQKLGIPKYVEDKEQRPAYYRDMDLRFEGAVKTEDGIVVRFKKADEAVEEAHARFYALTPNPQMVRGEEKGE